MVEIILQNKIKSRLELVVLAIKQKNEGKTALVEFIANRGNKIVHEALELAAEFDEAPQKLARNVFIYGPANTGKTFVISPLRLIFKTFTNPATGTFAWMGVEDAEVVLLNDFHWHPSIIAWGNFLQLLEGDTVHITAAKNFCSKDIEFKKDTPFFATADAPIVLVKGSSLDQSNTQMMQVRWVFFNFWRQIPQEARVNLSPCPRCFARLIIDYHDITQ